MKKEVIIMDNETYIDHYADYLEVSTDYREYHLTKNEAHELEEEIEESALLDPLYKQAVESEYYRMNREMDVMREKFGW